MISDCRGGAAMSERESGRVSDAPSSHERIAARERRGNLIIAVAAAVLVILALISLILGRYPIDPADAIRMLVARVVPLAHTWSDQAETLFFNVRLPRILLAALVGCGLSAAGAAHQGTFRNCSFPRISWVPRRVRPSVPLLRCCSGLHRFTFLCWPLFAPWRRCSW